MSFIAIPTIVEATVAGNHIANKKRRLIKAIAVMTSVRIIKVAIYPYDVKNVIKSLNQLPLKFIFGSPNVFKNYWNDCRSNICVHNDLVKMEKIVVKK